MSIMDYPSSSPPRSRQRYTSEFKSEVIAKACQPHVSIASVALAHGLNANMLRNWMQNADPSYIKRRPTLSNVDKAASISNTPAFLPVSFPENNTPKSDGRSIEIEVNKSGATIKVKWPVHASSSCLVWLREITK